MNLPNDPAMLLSVVNTKLRDFYPNLKNMCEDLDLDENNLIKQLESIGYTYDEKLNRFV